MAKTSNWCKGCSKLEVHKFSELRRKPETWYLLRSSLANGRQGFVDYWDYWCVLRNHNPFFFFDDKPLSRHFVWCGLNWFCLNNDGTRLFWRNRFIPILKTPIYLWGNTYSGRDHTHSLHTIRFLWHKIRYCSDLQIKVAHTFRISSSETMYLFWNKILPGFRKKQSSRWRKMAQKRWVLYPAVDDNNSNITNCCNRNSRLTMMTWIIT